jgi:hypothetical protein
MLKPLKPRFVTDEIGDIQPYVLEDVPVTAVNSCADKWLEDDRFGALLRGNAGC